MANVPISKIQVPGSEDTLLLRDSTAANKVQSATNGDLAGLDANGNLIDSGVGASSIGNLSGSHLGICETAASTSAKIVTIGDGTWIPKEGDIIGVKFTYTNTALFVTLNVNGIGNKSIWYGDSVDPSGADYICGKADSYIFYMYDGTYWIWLNEGQHDGNNFPSVAVYTASNQQVKIGTCNYYTLTNKSYCHFIFRYPNTCKDMLFMKINNSSSKTIYINGEISSSTNYTLPAGTYIAYYENDKWYFRTDGKLTANITGTADQNVNKSGDTMIGNLTIQKSPSTTGSVPTVLLQSLEVANEGRSSTRLYKSDNGITTDQGTLLCDYPRGGTNQRAILRIRENDTLANVLSVRKNNAQGQGTWYSIYGEHNKPTTSDVTGLSDALNGKVDTESGKGLSSNDYTNTDKAKVDKIDTTTTSASGNPISISGLKSNQLAVNPVITFEPIQAGSGDPSPSNVRAISGYDKIEVLSCGKNLVEKSILTSSIDIYGKIIQNNSYKMLVAKVKKGATYTITSDELFTGGFFLSSPDMGSISYDGQRLADASKTFTAPIDGYVAFRTSLNYASPQLELGQTATTFEPYHKTTDLSENLPQTVYGGQEVVRTGVLTSTMTNVDLSTLSWTYVSNYNCWRAVLSVAKVSSNDSPINGKADRYVIVKAEGYVQSHNSNTLAVSTSDYIFIDNGSTTTSPTGQLVCELKTPITIQLTPHEISLLKDYAYVSTNGTSMSFDYHNGEIATLGDVAQLGETLENSNQYIKETYGFKSGVFGIATTANVRKNISSVSDIVDGELPDIPNRCCYSAIQFSNAVPNNLVVACDGSTIFVYCDATNTRVRIRWIQSPYF